MDLQLYVQIIFNKAGRNVHWKKESLFNKWFWENWTTACRRMKLDHFLTPHTKTDSTWMKDLNMRKESIKILEENTGSNLFDLSHSNFFLGTLPKAREARAKMNYWDFIKIKSFLHSKGNSQQNQKTTDRMGEDICKSLIR